MFISEVTMLYAIMDMGNYLRKHDMGIKIAAHVVDEDDGTQSSWYRAEVTGCKAFHLGTRNPQRMSPSLSYANPYTAMCALVIYLSGKSALIDDDKVPIEDLQEFKFPQFVGDMTSTWE